MSTHRQPRRLLAVAVAATFALTASACGDTGAAGQPSAVDTSPSLAKADDAREHGDWLLRFTTAEGADGEQARAVFVSYDPATGATRVRALPAVTATDSDGDQQALLVSADHTRAIQDTGVPKSEARTGKLVLYSLAGDTTETVDIRALTGEPGLRAVGWAFDPTSADLLRVVDSDLRVWQVDLAAKSATKEGQLPKRSGWIFGNGFDKDTGEPYIESIDSDRTDPAGNGYDDTRPVEREGGTLLTFDGGDVEGLPKPPCGFAGGFEFQDGDAWLFCADTPSISAYRLGEGANPAWVPIGKPSAKVVPAAAAEMTFALPPVG